MKWHGIVLDAEFENPDFPLGFKIFAKRKSKTNPWTLFGIEINDDNLGDSIKSIQDNLKASQPYYAHLYNDEEVIVIFKEKVIKVKPNKSTWKPIVEYGKKLNIPGEQLDFWPNRFQDEIHYFDKEDFLNHEMVI